MGRVGYVDLRAEHAPLRDRLVAALDAVLEHGQFVLGPEVGQLERRLAERIGVPHVVTCGNGTDALVLALRLRGIGSGDEVIVPSHSFIATANAVRLVGARVRFADVRDDTMTIDVESVRSLIGPHTRAVIPVHLNGYPCPVDVLAALCADHGIALVEDCAQAFGARRGGRSVGSAELGCFSVHPLKGLSALGDGGFVAARTDEDGARLRELRNHGLVDRDHCARVGYNSRLDTLQAAFLLVKLDHFDGWLAARRAHALAYRQTLAGKVRLPPEDDSDSISTYSAFAVRHSRRDALVAALRDRDVDAKIHYPLAAHQQAAYADDAASLPVTERVVAQVLSLPITPELSAVDRDRVVAAVSDAVEEIEQ